MRRSTKLLTACAALTADCNNPSFEAVDLASLTSLCPEGLESGEHGSCNGTYHGVITIEASRADGELSSTCTGEMVVTIDTSATPSIRGAGSCEFDGLLSSLGPQEGHVDGRCAYTDVLSGEVRVGRDIHSSWQGGWTDEGSLEASFSGFHEVNGIELEYRGAFDAWPGG